MASSPTLRTTDEEDLEVDDTGTGNFNRGYRNDGKNSSPKAHHKEKDGIIYRLSGRVSQRNVELQAENSRLEEENNTLKLQYRSEKQKQLEKHRRLHAILHECNNVQIGEGNTLDVTHIVSDSEDPIPLLEEILKKTTEANDEIIKKLTTSESDLKKSQDYLQKIHAVVMQLRENSSPNTDIQMMEKLKEMVEIQTETAKTDVYNTIQKAFESLDIDDESKHFDNLSSDARRAIRILVYKFGSLTRETFANLLGLKLEKHRITGEEQIDENSCALIIIHWLEKRPENNAAKLLDVLKSFEDQLIQRSMKDLKEHMFTKNSATSDRVQRKRDESLLYSRTSQLGDSMSTVSQYSDLTDFSEALETLERFANSTLHTYNHRQLKDIDNQMLCGVYKLLMVNTRTLQGINEQISVTAGRFV